MAELQVSFSDRFWPSLNKLHANEVKQVTEAVEGLTRGASGAGLRFKPIQGDGSGRKWTCRASRDLRVLAFKQGDVVVLERAGHHDWIYDLARRVDIAHNEGTGRIVVTERASEEAPPVAYGERPTKEPDAPCPFDHWTVEELKATSLGADEVAALRSCRTEDEILALDLDEETLGLVIDLLGQTPEQWRTPSLDPEADRAERFARAITDQGALAGLSPLFTPDEISALLSAPIEDWMVFIHPEQRAAAERRYDGPARIRGSAGTGKTVVGLHRAAELVRRFRTEPSSGPQTVLVTTYISTLPKVFEQLYHRLPKTTATDDIEFCGIDRLARRICSEAGDRINIDPQAVDSAWAKSWSTSALRSAGFSPSYIQDEIRQVIKGRGITDLEGYLAVERIGRRTRFSAELRRQVWDLKQAWDGRLTTAGVHDFHDVMTRALGHARTADGPRYRSAVVDEAQDLTLVGLQLLRTLVNGPNALDRPDGLLIVGDGAQRIYAGGFTLRQAGVEVRGRTTVLRRNYRNTKEIIAAAMAVAGGEPVDDLGDTYARGDDEETGDADRSGMSPVLVGCAGSTDELRYLTERVVGLHASGTVGYGDLAIFTSTNKQADAVSDHLRLAGVPIVKLQDYTGAPVDKVKVGTHFRAKGLEFKVVFLPHLGAGEFPRRPYPGQPAEEVAEEESLALSRLFVAMTRARDGLFLLASGDPSPLLGSLDHFQVIDS